MKRGEIYWADLDEPYGRRPVVVLSRTKAAQVLKELIVAPITTRVRGLRSEVSLGPDDGLRRDSVASCQAMRSIERALLDPEPIGYLSLRSRIALDRALRYALEIRF